jgi:hypothetical protein
MKLTSSARAASSEKCPIGDIAPAFLMTEESATEMAISKSPGQCRGFEDFDFSVVD